MAARGARAAGLAVIMRERKPGVMFDKRACGTAAIAVLWLVRVFAEGPSFIPDATFKGTSLTGWHVLGQADWHAQNGEIVGTPKPGGSGGWLVLDRSYQDLGFYANLRSSGACRTGVLLRAEKTAEGMKGIYVSLSEGDVASYRVTLGADGQELQREALRPAAQTERIAPPPNPDAAGRGARGGRGGRGGGRGGATPVVDLPVKAPKPGLRPGDWNEVEIFLDANVVRWFLNDIDSPARGVADEEFGRYGPLALYVGGTGEVRFKDIAYKDLAMKVAPPEQVSTHFRMQRLNEFYYAWSAAAADFNHDGILDIVAGPYIYFGPDFTKSREIFMAHTWNPSREYATDCMVQFAYDFTGDGWPDVLCSTSGAVFLYVNPKGESRRWDKYQVIPSTQCEIMDFKDIDGDGKPELIYMGEGYLRYAKPDPANPTGPWTVHTISERGVATQHGIGVGDINGDGRPDIVNVFGWWEQPPADSRQELWTYHPEAFGHWTRAGLPGGALMGVYDVNGDGLNDVVTSMAGHGFGLAWFEQKRDAAGKISFVKHTIMEDYLNSAKSAGGVTFSELHGLAFADVDGDGVPDIIVGKRYWSHLEDYYDPDPYGPPVLYWYRTVRNPKAPGGAEFVPELIHNRSGAGSTLLAVDLNGDGAVDIVTATDRGTFIFWGKPRAGAAKKAAGRK